MPVAGGGKGSNDDAHDGEAATGVHVDNGSRGGRENDDVVVVIVIPQTANVGWVRGTGIRERRQCAQNCGKQERNPAVSPEHFISVYRRSWDDVKVEALAGRVVTILSYHDDTGGKSMPSANRTMAGRSRFSGRSRVYGRGRALLLGSMGAVALLSTMYSGLAAQENRVLVPHERVWSIPNEAITQPDVADRLGRFDRDASGGYSIYDKNGDHIGVGKPRSDGSIDLYDTRGRKGLEVRPERPRRK